MRIKLEKPQRIKDKTMITQTFGTIQEPFFSSSDTLLPQQQEIFDIVKIHANHGGFNVIIGGPGVGKSILREHIEKLGDDRDTVVISISRTMHTYSQILNQLADSMKVTETTAKLEKEMIHTALSLSKARKKLYVIIDEAHLLATDVLRKLRLFLEQFPKNHTLILFGQTGLLTTLALRHNADLKTRVTYSSHIQPLNDEDIKSYILSELEKSKLGANVFDEGAIDLIARAVDGNLRLCRNLSYYSLVEACRQQERQVNIHHVNAILVMPHWRSHEEILERESKRPKQLDSPIQK
jgi:MSHA biogenesis protein MshM